MKRRIPILAFVLAALLALNTLLLGALAAYDHHRSDARLSANLSNKINGLADRLALAMVLPIWNFDFAQVDGTVDSLMADPEVKGVLIRLEDRQRSETIRGRDNDGRPIVLNSPPVPEDGLEAVRPVAHGGDRIGSVTVFGSSAPKNRALRRELIRQLGAIVAVDLGLVALLYLVLWTSILRPLKRIEDYAGAVAAGQPGASLDLHSKLAEVDRLAASIGAMVRLLDERYENLQRSESRLRETQKMESVGQLAGGVAHDFNNILQLIVTCAHLVGEALPPGHPAHADLDAILEGGARGTKLVKQLLQFSRRQVVEPRRFSLVKVVTDLAGLLERVLGETVRLQTRFPEGPVMVRMDPGQFEQLLFNLCINARDAMPNGGNLLLALERVQVKSGDHDARPAAQGPYVVLAVTDQGLGISPEVLPHIFEPFYTTKAQGKGSGLGLATCFGIAAQSGGFITVESKLGEGSSFRVWLPEAAPGPESPAEAAQAAKAAGGHERILLAEDEATIRLSLKRLLESQGYAVTAVDGGARGLTEAAAGPFDAVVSDLVMPDMTGRDFVTQLRLRWPRTRALFMSGYSRALAGQELELGAHDAFLEKPFQASELFAKLRQLLDRPDA